MRVGVTRSKSSDTGCPHMRSISSTMTRRFLPRIPPPSMHRMFTGRSHPQLPPASAGGGSSGGGDRRQWTRNSVSQLKLRRRPVSSSRRAACACRAVPRRLSIPPAALSAPRHGYQTMARTAAAEQQSKFCRRIAEGKMKLYIRKEEPKS